MFFIVLRNIDGCSIFQLYYSLNSYRLNLVDLKQINTQYFSSKMDLFWDNKELKFGTCSLMVNHMQVQRTKERKESSEGLL